MSKSIKFIKATVCNGEAVSIGQVLEVSDADARLLFGYKKAVPAPEKKVTKKKAAKK